MFLARSVLGTKLRRELWRMRGQVLAIALVIAGGVAVCVMSLVAYSSLNATRELYYQQNQFAEVFAPLKRAPRQALHRVSEIPGVVRLSARVEAAAKLELPGFTEPVSARVLSVPESGQPEVNRLFVRQGRLPAPGRNAETAIVGAFAEAHGLRPGDRFSVIINGRKQTLIITGIVESPEFIYVLPPGGMLPDFKRFGVLWLSQESLSAAMDMRGAFNSVVVRVQPGYPLASVIHDLDRELDRYGATGAFSRRDQFSHRFLSDDLDQLKIMATVFPLIFMSVAMFLLHVVISRLVNTQRDIIAVLKAFGYSNRQIAWHYSQLVLSIAALGLAMGLVAGIWLGRGLGELYMEFYRLPGLLFRLNPAWLALLILVTAFVAWLGGWRAIRQAAALPPAEAMRPEGPARFRMVGAERWLSGLRLSPPSRMIIRQMARRPLRALLSMVGIAMATAIVMVGNFQFDSVSLMVQTEFARVQQQDLTATLVEPVNAAALFGLQRQPGIRYAEGRRSVAVRLVNGHRDRRSVLHGMPAEARLQFVVDQNLQSVTLPQDGLLLTDFLATELGVSPGEYLRVEMLEGDRRTFSVPVAGVTSEFLGVGAYMRLPALNRALGEGPVINQILLSVDPASNDEVYQSLREAPRVLGIGIRQAMLDSFYDTLARTFLTFTFFNSLLGAIIAFGVIYNTIRIALAEKGRELASLRVMGYTHNEIAHILFGDMAVMLVVGIVGGWLFGQGLAWMIITAMQTELYRVPLTITAHTLGISATVVFVSAIVSGGVAWWRLRHLDLVAVLKTRE